MAKSKKPAKSAKAAKAKKPVVVLTGPKGGKRYTTSQLVAHLAAQAEGATGAPVAKKAVKAMLEELGKVALAYAAVGAPIAGLGKVVLRQLKARPAREGINPKTGEKIQIAAKPARTKLVFRFSKAAKEAV